MEISAVTKMIPLSRHDSLYLHKETLFPWLLFLPCEDSQRPQHTFGHSGTCLVHTQTEHPEHWPWVLLLPRKPQPQPRRSAAISDTSPHAQEPGWPGRRVSMEAWPYPALPALPAPTSLHPALLSPAFQTTLLLSYSLLTWFTHH